MASQHCKATSLRQTLAEKGPWKNQQDASRRWNYLQFQAIRRYILSI